MGYTTPFKIELLIYGHDPIVRYSTEPGLVRELKQLRAYAKSRKGNPPYELFYTKKAYAGSHANSAINQAARQFVQFCELQERELKIVGRVYCYPCAAHYSNTSPMGIAKEVNV